MQISANFTLEELTRSDVGDRNGIPNDPSAIVIYNLIRLAETILQPLRDHLGKPITINSAYRSLEINKKVGGSSKSQHMKGEAADIRVANMPVKDLVDLIKKLDLPYHQLINEFDHWVHVSIAPEGQKPKKQILHFERK